MYRKDFITITLFSILSICIKILFRGEKWSKSMKKILKTITLIYILVFSMGMTVSANYPLISAENFDYDWYLEQHPDLAALIPADNHDAIWNFYITTGEPAGWLGRKTQLSRYTIHHFDFDYFMANNPDVVAALGTDRETLFNWYVTTGYDAKRPARSTSEYINAKILAYEMVAQITNNSMSDREKVKAVHDWLCINVAYDIDNYNAGTIPGSSYQLQGPILYGKSVCGGYAEAFQFFMDIVGIKCETITGTATNSSGHTGSHAWNRVKIDNQWLYLDVTWDDPIPDKPGVVRRYTYFLISEAQMNRNHYPAK